MIITFKISYKTVPGQCVLVCGNIPQLGSWNAEHGLELKWEDGSIWTGYLSFEPTTVETKFQYKYIIRDSAGNITWEQRSNRECVIQKNELNQRALLLDCWDDYENSIVRLYNVDPNQVAIAVLGKKLKPNGIPTHVLKLRMETAAQVYFDKKSQGKQVLMIVSGGKVQKMGNRKTEVESEAEVMKKLAMQHKVPEASILMDANAKNTIENVINIKKLLIQKGIFNVTVVTSDFHMPRAKKLFNTILHEKEFVMEFVEDKPKLNEEEAEEEQIIEEYMMSHLENHLEGYKQYWNNDTNKH